MKDIYIELLIKMDLPLNYQTAGDKIYVCKIKKKVLIYVYGNENSKDRANRVDPDEVAHDEPPHLDLHCLQIQKFLFLPTKCEAVWVHCHVFLVPFCKGKQLL